MIVVIVIIWSNFYLKTSWYFTARKSLVIEINWFWTFGDQSYPGPEGSHKEELTVFVCVKTFPALALM